ncbi:Odorant receptor 429, partial [Nylanderia fulva]
YILCDIRNFLVYASFNADKGHALRNNEFKHSVSVNWWKIFLHNIFLYFCSTSSTTNKIILNSSENAMRTSQYVSYFETYTSPCSNLNILKLFSCINSLISITYFAYIYVILDLTSSRNEGIFYAIYATSWFTLPLTLKKDMHFAIMNLSIPFRLTGGKFFYTTYFYISVLRVALLTK